MTSIRKFFLLLPATGIMGCQQQPDYPAGGYPYPKNIADSDTNLYHYQIKDSGSKMDAFRDSYSYLFYRAFNEPNLSIKPRPKETYRLVYSTAFHGAVIITFTEDSLIVKEGDATVLYTTDTTRLTAIEKLHLKILNRRFPIEETKTKNPFVKRYLDSMVKLYPQLLEPAYYHKIFEKAFVYTGEKFTPLTTRVSFTRQQYQSIIQEINASGFWALPYQIECKNQWMDAPGFHLEANTGNRYKIVQVNSCPDDSTKFTKACQQIVEIAKMEKKVHLTWSGKTVTVEPDIELREIKPLKPVKKK